MDEKSDKSAPRKAKTRRKARLVEIEDMDSQGIQEVGRLKSSILDIEKDINRFNNAPLVALHNSAAKQVYSTLQIKIAELRPTLNSIDSDLQKPALIYDFNSQISLLNQKKELIYKLYIDIHPLITELDMLQEEAYPKKLNEEHFRNMNNEIVRTMKQLRHEMQLKKNQSNQSEIGAAIFTQLSQLLSDFNTVDGVSVTRIAEQYKERPSSFNSEQYAGIINARNNLRLLEEEFKLILSTYDEKIQFEEKRNEVSQLADDLSITYSHLYNLRSFSSPLVANLRELLYSKTGNPKTLFNTNDFKLTLGEPLPSMTDFNRKAEEVKTARQALLKIIKEHQSNINPNLKKEIEALSSRARIFEVLSQGKSIDFRPIHHALNLDFGGARIRDNLVSLRHLINLDEEKIIESMALNNAIHQDFLREFPEVRIEGDNLLVDNKNYLLTDSKDFGYSEARKLILIAITNGDDHAQDYKKIHSKLIEARDSLKAYITEQNILSKPRQDLADLKFSLDGKLTVIKPSPTQILFNVPYASLLSSINALRINLSLDNLTPTIISFQKCSDLFHQYESLQQKFDDQSNQINELKKVFSELLKNIDQEQQRIAETYNKSEPCVALLEELKGPIQGQIDLLEPLNTRIQDSLNDLRSPEVVKATLEATSLELKEAAEKIVTKVQGILTDEKLEGLTLSTKNLFLALLAKLIRPLIALINKDKSDQKPGFFVSQTELTLKALRDNTKGIKAQESDLENVDPKQKNV